MPAGLIGDSVRIEGASEGGTVHLGMELFAYRAQIKGRYKVEATHLLVTNYDWTTKAVSFGRTAVPSRPADPPNRWVHSVVSKMSGAIRTGMPPPGE